MSLQNPVPERDVVNKLLRKLTIVRENILEEAAAQPLRFVSAARYRVKKMEQRYAAEAALEAHQAQLALKIRARKTAMGEKPTDSNVKQLVEADKTTRNLRRVLDKTFAGEEFGKLLMEAYRHRRDALDIISRGQAAEGMSEDALARQFAERQRLAERARTLDNS